MRRMYVGSGKARNVVHCLHIHRQTPYFFCTSTAHPFFQYKIECLVQGQDMTCMLLLSRRQARQSRTWKKQRSSFVPSFVRKLFIHYGTLTSGIRTVPWRLGDPSMPQPLSFLFLNESSLQGQYSGDEHATSTGRRSPSTSVCEVSLVLAGSKSSRGTRTAHCSAKTVT
jgi:hypothetical protein